MIHPDFAFAFFQGRLDRPAQSAHADEFCARASCGRSSFLIADSADADFQSALCDGDHSVSTVLVVPRKLAPEFFDAVNPQYAVVLGGASARDKPAPDLLATLAPATILQTSERGTIEMIVEGQALKIRTER